VATLDRTLDLIALLRRIAIPLRGRRSLADHFAWLDETLRTTQMAASFRTDAVGATLLEYLERLGSEALTAAKGEVFTFGEWRAFVADALENATFREDSVDSSVVALSLGAAAYRPFDAVLILGADASHFPGQLTEKLFLNQSVRAELGLPLASAAEREQLCQLALLMAATPEVAITWRKTLERQPNALAAPLQRLSILHKAAFGSDLIRNVQWDEWAVAMRSTHRPAPQAEDRLPDHLSASAYDRLVSCPYRYFVRYVLQVQPLDEMSEDADKRDYGEIVHRIFEEFHAVCAAPEPAFESVEKLRQISRAVFNREVGDNPAFLGYRQRFETVIEPYVRWWAEWTKQGWRFAQAELRRERVMMLQGAPSLLLNGRLDRLDEGPSGLAILDYKARSVSTLRRELKALTEEVQLPFYRLLVPDARRVRAGYLSVDQKEVQTVGLEVDIDRMALALSARIRHDFERLHRGAGLPANGADTTCAYCDERGLCRKGQWSESEGGPEGASGSPAA
jgi:ATP-dependent helicase/nuclease subunit B